MKHSKHIIFDPEYQKIVSQSKFKDCESWNIETSGKYYKFGGKVNTLINLIVEFPEIPEYLSWLNINTLTLGLNFEDFFNSILDNKILSYKHYQNGLIEQITCDIKISNNYSNFPLKETKIRLAQTPIALQNQKWRGNTNKMNSNPIWVQNEDIPSCPICNEEMKFLIQLSSGLPDMNDKNNNRIMFGNDGELYGFWCSTDLISSYIWQST